MVERMNKGGASVGPRPPSVPDEASLADVLERLPTAVVLLDAAGQPVWANDVVRALTRESDQGFGRLLAVIATAVAEATQVGETGSAVSTAQLPTDRGLLDREIWTTVTGSTTLRVATFLPDAEAVPGLASADEQRHRLEAMLAHTDDLITLLAADGTIRASNAAAGRLTGFAGGGVNGRKALDFVHPDDFALAGEALAEVLAEPGATARAEIRVRFADGTWHDVEASVTNLLDDRSVASLVISMHDVTDRTLAEQRVTESEAKFRSLVENLTDVIVVLDEEFQVIYATPGIEQIIDAPAATNMGMSAFNDVHPEDLGRVIETLGALASAGLGETTRVELRLEARPGSGRWRWIEATAVNRLLDPNVGGMVCTLRDVTEAKDAAAELQAAFERLRELDTLKDQFLNSVSHEMRTPLAIIIGFADLLDRGDELDAAIRAEAVDRIRSSAAEMRTMVENVLDFSALESESRSFFLRPVRVSDPVAVMLSTARTLLAEHVLVVDVPEGLECVADHEALERVLRNLVVNAAKYSERGRTITLTAVAEDDGSVRIDVTDEGVGIPDDQQALVFDRLYRGPGAAFVARGTGIGLHMVKRSTELMNGSVSIRSAVGEGSTFTVRLGGVG